MAKGNKIQKAVLHNAEVVKVTGVFEKDGESIEYEKLTLVIDGELEFDISMDSSVKKLFTRIVKFEDVEQDAEDDE